MIGAAALAASSAPGAVLALVDNPAITQRAGDVRAKLQAALGAV